MNYRLCKLFFRKLHCRWHVATYTVIYFYRFFFEASPFSSPFLQVSVCDITQNMTRDTFFITRSHRSFSSCYWSHIESIRSNVAKELYSTEGYTSHVSLSRIMLKSHRKTVFEGRFWTLFDTKKNFLQHQYTRYFGESRISQNIKSNISLMRFSYHFGIDIHKIRIKL